MLMAPDGTFIGESVINELDRENSSANFRIVIFDEGYLGQGLGSWAVEKTRDFAFEQVGLHRLELEVFPSIHAPNVPMKKLAFVWKVSNGTAKDSRRLRRYPHHVNPRRRMESAQKPAD